MSGVAGVFVPSGRCVDEALVARVTSRIAYRGPDGMRVWRGPGVAMAFARHVRTPDAAADVQPLHDLASDTCATFAGRLDNREDLAGALGLRLASDTSDAALAAAAYRRWGVECPAHLLGDFSLAIWDGRAGRLLLARDVMGCCPLFYRELGGAWWWASDQRALLEPGIPPINEGYLAEHLSCRITSVDETIYLGIERLPMAHAIAVTASGSRRWRYWRPRPDAPARRDAAEASAQFRTLLKEAVRARLRLHGRAGIMLSGGIDSTSVAVQVAELRREGHEGAGTVKAFSMTIPGSPACEGARIRRVLERVPLPSAMLPAREPDEALFTRDAAASLDLPPPPSSSMILPLRDALAASGRSVVLTGYGEDWFDSSFAEISDALRRGRLIAAAGRLRAMRRVRNYTAAPEIARQGVWMALPEGVKGVVRRLLRRDPVPWWIAPEFAKRHDLADRLRRVPDRVEFESLAQYDIFRWATDGDATYHADHDERCAAALGLEQRHPLMDRRLIELGLDLAPVLRCSGGVTKALMRRANAGVLPPDVTTSPPNDDFGFLGLRVLAHLGGPARLAATQPVRRGWIRREAIERLYGKLEGGATRCLWPLNAAAGIDFWLRALEAAPSARRGQDHEAGPLIRQA